MIQKEYNLPKSRVTVVNFNKSKTRQNTKTKHAKKLKTNKETIKPETKIKPINVIVIHFDFTENSNHSVIYTVTLQSIPTRLMVGILGHWVIGIKVKKKIKLKEK